MCIFLRDYAKAAQLLAQKFQAVACETITLCSIWPIRKATQFSHNEMQKR